MHVFSEILTYKIDSPLLIGVFYITSFHSFETVMRWNLRNHFLPDSNCVGWPMVVNDKVSYLTLCNPVLKDIKSPVCSSLTPLLVPGLLCYPDLRLRILVTEHKVEHTGVRQDQDLMNIHQPAFQRFFNKNNLYLRLLTVKIGLPKSLSLTRFIAVISLN